MSGPEEEAGAAPPWLDAATLHAMRRAARGAASDVGGASAAHEAAWAVALARHPALPTTLLAEAVLVATEETGPTATPSATGLVDASFEEVAESLCYALRFDERGRPRRTGAELQSRLAAEVLLRQLLRSNFVIMRRPPLPAHRGG